MIPIFLWSVVVTQSIQRLVCRGCATSWATIWGTGRTRLGQWSWTSAVLWLPYEVSGCAVSVLAQLGDLRVGGLDQLLAAG